MPNPFAGASQNTSGQPAYGGSGIAAPAPSNVPTAPVPGAPQQIPGQTPFSGLLTSDSPGIFGLLGRMAGNPTSQEMMYRRMGNQQAEGLRGLTERLGKGMDQRSAILDFMNNDPRAMEFFGSSADPVGAIRGALGTLAPPPHFGTVGNSTYDQYTGKIVDSAPTNLGPGDQRINGAGQVLAQNLPADVQSQQAFIKAAGMSDADAQQLAKAAAVAKSTTDIGVKSDALNQLVKQGIITPDVKNKIASGVVQISPFFDAGGHQLGQTYTDLTDFMASGGKDPSKIKTTVLGANNQNQLRNIPGGDKVDEYGVPLGLHPSADIILGAGPVGKLADHLSAYASIVDPQHLSAEFYNDAHDKLERVVSILGDLTQQGGGGRFQGPYNQLKDMVEEHGYTGSPIQQGIALRNLIQMAKTNILVNNSQISDMSGTVTGPSKDKLSEENGRLRMMLALLPDEAANEQVIDKARKGAGGAKEAIQTLGQHIGETVQGVKDNLQGAFNGAQDAAQTAVGAATGAPPSQGQTAPQSFQNEQDATAAAGKGLLQDGASVTIGGRPAIYHAAAKGK